jgi:integrase
MTLGDILLAYREQVSLGKSYISTIGALNRQLGHIKIRQLGQTHLQEFITKRLNKDGVNGSSLALDLSVLGGALRWAKLVKGISLNDGLAKDARRSLTQRRISTRSNERDRLATPEEIEAIINWLDANPKLVIPTGDIVRFASVSAMRLSEIFRIRIEDVSWNNKTVVIRQRKHPQRKATNDQTVPLVGESFDIVRKYAEGRTQGPIFQFNARSAAQAFSNAVAKLKIEHLTFHDLRHYAATNLFKMGLPIQLVAIVTGHSDWKQLKRYTQLDANDVHTALERLK